MLDTGVGIHFQRVIWHAQGLPFNPEHVHCTKVTDYYYCFNEYELKGMLGSLLVSGMMRKGLFNFIIAAKSACYFIYASVKITDDDIIRKDGGRRDMRWEDGDEMGSVHVCRRDVDVSVSGRAEKAVGRIGGGVVGKGKVNRRLLLWVVSLYG